MESRMDMVWKEVSTTQSDIAELLRCVQRQSAVTDVPKEGQITEPVILQKDSRPGRVVDSANAGKGLVRSQEQSMIQK
jgi:hypothetical protein